MASNTINDSGLKQFLPTDYSTMLGNNSNLCSHWNTFFQSFNQLSSNEVEHRNSGLLRLLKENGVTYNIYDDPAGLNRAWQLDLLPTIICKEEWATIESGLIQRAELLNLILKDIYGEKKLFKNGLLPMAPIYRHPGFLRQCDGIELPGKNSLVFYAADMARGVDGKIWIVSDRTQAPSGYGYALENRTAIARVLPELFTGLKVRWLSPFFNSVSNALIGLAPKKQQQNPRVVILTPGPSNETYFEHSYLSSYLGFTLVEGNDLVVKDNYVWLKTLEGLERIDVIMGRVDDIYCDPLELKG
ncbi:MAG: circularly permuted type 2 ATP-grasp protein, partial [Sphingobacteriales bacterium]|nr:circularly permuted type 2 ATP-grasp protein [Sphingobacteriales bacterium]